MDTYSWLRFAFIYSGRVELFGLLFHKDTISLLLTEIDLVFDFF